MNTSEYPFFTVIIPQKNRAEYIYHTLRTCMIQDYPNFEVIVSDDCSTDNSVEVVEQLAARDSRIKLFAHKEHLGMHDNFEFALNQVKPGYVLALGGDDGLAPNCIWRMYEILKQTGKELLTWQAADFAYADPASGGHNIFRIKRYKRKEVRILKSADYLKKISQTFMYLVWDCPMFYIKGVVSTELVNRVKSRTPDHSFYYCPTPDGFSGVVLAGEVDEYAYTNEPLTIGGTTIKSQGMNYRRTDEKSRAEARQFFNDSIQHTMHSQLASQPYSPLIPLMTADYLLTAQDLPGWPGKCYEVSFELLLKKTFSYLENSYFEDDVLHRELYILKQIAIQHDLLPLYDSLYKKTRRKVTEDKAVYGTLISNSIRFDGSEICIDNIFDAAMAVNFLFNVSVRFSPKAIWKVFKNSVRNVIVSRKHKNEKLPVLDIGKALYR